MRRAALSLFLSRARHTRSSAHAPSRTLAVSRGDLLRSESVLELKPTAADDPASKAELEAGSALPGGERYDDEPQTATASAMPYAGRNRFRMSMD